MIHVALWIVSVIFVVAVAAALLPVAIWLMTYVGPAMLILGGLTLVFIGTDQGFAAGIGLLCTGVGIYVLLFYRYSRRRFREPLVAAQPTEQQKLSDHAPEHQSQKEVLAAGHSGLTSAGTALPTKQPTQAGIKKPVDPKTEALAAKWRARIDEWREGKLQVVAARSVTLSVSARVALSDSLRSHDSFQVVCELMGYSLRTMNRQDFFNVAAVLGIDVRQIILAAEASDKNEPNKPGGEPHHDERPN